MYIQDDEDKFVCVCRAGTTRELCERGKSLSEEYCVSQKKLAPTNGGPSYNSTLKNVVIIK